MLGNFFAPTVTSLANLGSAIYQGASAAASSWSSGSTTSLQSLVSGSGSKHYDPYASGGPLEWVNQTPKMNVSLPTQSSSGSAFAPEQTSLQYWYEAAQQKVGLLPGLRDAPRDAIQLNDRITGQYAEMYRSDPDTYKWAGMAAYASEVVGDAMRMAQWAAEQTSGTFAQDVLNLIGVPTGQQLAGSLAAGNRLVYDDIYWQHLAHREGGSELIREIHKNQPLDERIVNAWTEIDQGRSSRNPDLVWSGNKTLLQYEQSQTLQVGVYDKLPGLWYPASALASSPIPGDSNAFWDVVPGGDLGNFDQRWTWITGSMLPAYKQLDTQNRDIIVNDMKQYQLIGDQH